MRPWPGRAGWWCRPCTAWAGSARAPWPRTGPPPTPSDYTLTWWITAGTPAGIDAGLAGLAVALQPALSGVLPLEALREGAVQWLAAHRGWLLVLDNVTDPADIAPLLARARPAGT